MSNELYIDKKLSRNVKRIILLAMDLILILLSMILSREFLDIIVDIPNEQFYIAVVFVQIVYVAIAIRLKVFSLITRYTGTKTYVKIGGSLLCAYVFLLFFFNIYLERLQLSFYLGCIYYLFCCTNCTEINMEIHA